MSLADNSIEPPGPDRRADVIGSCQACFLGCSSLSQSLVQACISERTLEMDLRKKLTSAEQSCTEDHLEAWAPSGPSSATNTLCELGKCISPLWALCSLSAKGTGKFRLNNSQTHSTKVNTVFGVKDPASQPRLCYFLVVWPWGDYWSSLSPGV